MNAFTHHDLSTNDWILIRKDLTTKIFGKPVTLTNQPEMKLTLTKVEPKGEFRQHTDDYNHLFYILDGEGYFTINTETIKASANMIIEIKAGVTHSYKNNSNKELLLLTFNIPNQ